MPFALVSSSLLLPFKYDDAGTKNEHGAVGAGERGVEREGDICSDHSVPLQSEFDWSLRKSLIEVVYLKEQATESSRKIVRVSRSQTPIVQRDLLLLPPYPSLSGLPQLSFSLSSFPYSCSLLSLPLLLLPFPFKASLL